MTFCSISLKPSCKSTNFQMYGTGTEQVEEVLRTNFNKVPIIRVDHDTTKKVGAMEDIINDINPSESAIC